MSTATVETAPVTFRAIFRCARCKKAGARDTFRVTLTRLSPYRVQDAAGSVYATAYAHSVPPIACPGGCGAEVWGAEVEGRLVESIACTAKCRNAKGPSCDCSCGGENHGHTWD